MKYFIISFGIILFVLFSTSCNLVVIPEPCMRDYSFEIPVVLNPALDTFKIGDTIHIEIAFPVEMKDQKSGEYFDMSEFPFNLEFNISWIDIDPAISADKDITYVPKTGDIQMVALTGANAGKAVLLRLVKENRKFKHSFDIIVNKSGLLVFGFDANIDNYFSYSLDDDCRNENYSILFNLNNGLENNFELLQYSIDEYYHSIEKEYFDSWGGYVFVVE